MQAIGIVSPRKFPDDSFSASSSKVGYGAYNARLNGNGAWLPSSDVYDRDFLQINLGSEVYICAVATQGDPAGDHWTTKYKIMLSFDSSNWETYNENGKEKVCNNVYMTVTPIETRLSVQSCM